jgi:hypothetical protein
VKYTCLLTLLTFGTALQLSAQHYADKWYFGTKAAIDFTSGSAAAVTTSEMSAGEGSASIADPATGALLFYTDGINVWNTDNAIMPNGTGLMGGLSSTQAALIVPKPESADEYYIFTTDQIGGSQGLRYSVVDLSLDGGNGDVTEKNVLLKAPVAEKVTAVQDAGTFGVWMVAHGWGDDAFYAFRITPAGIDSAVVSHAGIVHSDAVIQNSYGQMKFNPCGDRLALAAGYLDKVELFDFNIVTGAVSNPKTISYSDHVYGIEFSRNGDVLYVSTYDPNGTLVQYDLSITDVNAMVAAAQVVSTTADIYPLQRGPDGRIYVCKSFSQYLGVIHSPDNVGAVSCSYVDNGFDLDPAFLGLNSALGLPNFVTSYTGGTESCVGSTNAVGENAAGSNMIFPNPSNDDFTFVAQQPGVSVTVSDLSGKELDRWKDVAGGTEITFGGAYAAGTYLVKTAGVSGGVSVRKLVKTGM